MNIRHSRARSTIVAGGVLAMAATALAAAPPATAAPSEAGSIESATKALRSLGGAAGERSAGIYLDRSTGKAVVTVTDAAGARTVRAAGAQPERVARSGADLKDVMAELARDATVPGTAWAVDPAANQVVLTMDGTVKGNRLATVRRAAAEHGPAVRLDRVKGSFRMFTRGGEAIHTGSGGRCSLGFNVRRGGTYYFLTAGHCTDIASSWYADSGGTRKLGDTAGSSFPGNDYGIVRYSSPPSDTQGSVYLYSGVRDITGAGNAYVGQTVRRSGSTTGVHGGRVTALDQTVNYREGTVRGLIRTTVCAEPGDSGGSLFAGSTALGLTSGGSGNCWWGGTTFFQPVTEALNRYGVSVY